MKLLWSLVAGLVAGGVSLVVMAPEAVAQVCASGLPGGDGGGFPGFPPPGVPTLSTGITAVLVAAVAGVGAWSLRRSGRGLGGTLAVGLLAVLGVPAHVRARAFSGARRSRPGPRRRQTREILEPWRRPSRARRVGLAVLAASMLAVSFAPSPAGASHESGWSSISIEEGWDYNQPSWWTEWELDWESRRGIDVDCGPASGGDGWACTSHRPHKFIWTGYAEAPDGSGKGWEQLSMELRSHSDPNYSGIWSWEETASVDCFGTGSSSHYCSYPDNSVHPFDWRMNTPTTPPQSQWKYYETVWGGNDYFAVDISGNYYHSGTQYFLGDGVDPWNYRFHVDDLGTWPDIVTNKDNIPPVLTLQSPNNEDLHRCGTDEFEQAFTVSATDAEGHNWTAHVQVWDPDGVRIVNEITPKTSSGSSASTSTITLPHKNGTYTWSATPTDTSGESTDTGTTKNGSFEFIFNLPPEVPTLVAPTSDDPDNPPVVLDTQPPSFVIETTDPEEDDYQGFVEVLREGVPVAGVETTQAKSGTQAVAQLDEPLPPGDSYEWRAWASDVLASGTPETSAFSAKQPFEVVRTATNNTPAPPTLVAPDGASFAHGADQTFTLRATDPDGDDYLGLVTVTDTATGDETSFTTETAASGADSSGSPPVPLEAGDYEWSAVAVDSRGAAGEQSTETGTFSVEAPPPNLAPTVSLVSPAEGHDYQHRDLQVFTVEGDDPEGDPYTASVRVGGDEVCETPLAPSGAEASCSPVEPVGPGEHSWTAVATDVNDNEGDAPAARDLTVLANRAPDEPSLVEPADGHTFTVGDPQMFAVTTTDPDGDSYSGEVIVRTPAGVVVDTVETANAPSGFNSYGVATPPLAPGDYTWTAAAIDVGDERSAESSEQRSFSVNTPPDTPTLVAPDASGFDHDDPQVFTINTTDADNDPYAGTVSVFDGDGAKVREIATAPTASGTDSSGVPTEPLEPGDYTWSAHATDIAGVPSLESDQQPFTVGPSLEDCTAWLASEGAEGSRDACGDAAGVAEAVWGLRDAGLEAVDDAQACAAWIAGDRTTDACPEEVRNAVIAAEGAVNDGQACAAWIASEANEGSRDACGDAAPLIEAVWGLRDTGLEAVDDAQACAAWIAGDRTTDACPEEVRNAVIAAEDDAQQAVDDAQACSAWLASEGAEGSRAACGDAAGVAELFWQVRDLVLDMLFGAVDDAQACSVWLASEGAEGSRAACGEAAGVAEAVWGLRDAGLEAIDDAQACAAWIAGDRDTPECPQEVRDAVIVAEDEAQQAVDDAQACSAWLASEGAEGSRAACGEAAGVAEAVWGLRDAGLEAVDDAEACAAWIAGDRTTDACPEEVRNAVTAVENAGENEPPAAPALVDPPDNSSHNRGQPEHFTVNATDPNSDPYSATVTVREEGTSCDGPVVQTIETMLAPSGADSRGTVNELIEPGAYCWSATATDIRGAPGAASASRTFTVTSVSSSSGDPPLAPLL